jgi:arginase
MTVLHIPYHLDEHLPDLGIPLPAGADIDEVTADLPDADVWGRLVSLYDQVAEVVAVQAAGSGSGAVTVLTGDCTLSIGVTAGLQRAGLDPALVWIDAHGDVQSLETTASGYLGGMSLRFLLGYRNDLVADPVGLRPPAHDRVLLVDARDLEPAEVDYIEATPIRRHAVADLSADDLPDGPLLVNLDLDTLDPAFLPGLRYPAADGPDEPTLIRAVRTIFATGRVAALNLACTWEPGTATESTPSSESESVSDQGAPDDVRARLVATILDIAANPTGR